MQSLIPVLMPRLGESVTEGTVVRWLARVGDHVVADEPLLEVSTDKVDTEIPSPVSGVLREINVADDETVEVGVQLAIIDSGPDADEVPVVADLPAVTTAAPTPAPSQAAEPERGERNTYLTPLVRSLARTTGIDLSTVAGTAAGGRISRADVLTAVARTQTTVPTAAASTATVLTTLPAAASRGDRVEPMSRLRQVIATRMLESLATSAQLTTVIEVDVTRIARLRDQAKVAFEERTGTKLSYLPFFARAAVEALRAHPVVNSSVNADGKSITYHAAQHLAIAVDSDRGLMAPVIRDAGDLNLVGLARAIADVASRTRAGTIGPDELTGGTFTLTNTGSRGALFDTPIINQPQVAILGTGAVVERPVVVTGDDGKAIAIRSMVYLALSYDHRIIDGADAARFLVTIKDRLQEGSFEHELGLR